MAHASNKVPSIPNYSTISRRVNSQDIRISERREVGNDIVIAVDVQMLPEWLRDRSLLQLLKDP
ncbi:MAG: hypothetical protein WAK50_09550 [Nitrososphaeraceae archaeon]